MCKRRRRHDPGKVIADLAVTIAGGGDALANLLGLRLQPDVYGPVASVPTAFRVIDAIDDTLLAAIRQAFEVPPLAEAHAASSNGAVAGIDYHPIA